MADWLALGGSIKRGGCWTPGFELSVFVILRPHYPHYWRGAVRCKTIHSPRIYTIEHSTAPYLNYWAQHCLYLNYWAHHCLYLYYWAQHCLYLNYWAHYCSVFKLLSTALLSTVYFDEHKDAVSTLVFFLQTKGYTIMYLSVLSYL